MSSTNQIAATAEPVHELSNFLKEISDSMLEGVTINPDPLDVMYMLKRAEEYLKVAKKNVMGAANAQYKTMRELEPNTKRFVVGFGKKGFVRDFTPRPTWKYSEELTDLIAEVKDRQKHEQELEIAEKIVKETDLDKSPVFALTINDNFE